MADINNLNSGDSSSSYGRVNAGGNNVNNPPKVNVSGQTEYSHSWKRTPRPFGLNVRVPQNPIGIKTQNLIKKTVSEIVLAPVQQIVDYLKTNENVFNGSVAAEIKSLEKQQQITVELLQDSDEIVMTDVPSFMMDM